MYASLGSAPELAVLSTPLQLHAQQTCHALLRESHVLCEKPLCVTPGQIREMIRARDRAKRIVAVGYQWSFSPAIQKLKADVLAGVFGKPKRLRTLVLWPRDEAYYRRNRWAGAMNDGNGNPVLDSPVNNACAHYLHNPFYLLGPRVDLSAEPARVTAELYRANKIENYDTAALRCFTTDGVEILFIVSHAVAQMKGPIFSYECERATIDFTDREPAGIVARFADGATRNYGSPNDQKYEKLWGTMSAIRSGGRSVCGIEAAASHTRCTWAAQQSVPEITTFPPHVVRAQGVEGSRKTWVEGLDDVLDLCYQQWKLPSELVAAAPWAARGDEIAVESLDLAAGPQTVQA
jgi:predicted dehydrogenase